MKHQNKTLTIIAISALCLVALTGCQGAKRELGLTRQAPDEFAVVKRAPLAMPPEYSLRPPQPGAPRPQEQQAAEQARTTVFGESAAQNPASPGSAEAQLLQQAGTGVAEPNIRERVDREAADDAGREKPVAERLLGWRGRGSESSAAVLDAEAEAARLEQNRQDAAQ